MDSNIISALIGALATIVAVVLAWWLQQRKAKVSRLKPTIKPERTSPDEDDIYFMTYLLHDGYEQKRPFTSQELSEHHTLAPLEIEIKLINLENNGYVQRTNRKNEGSGEWQILSKGVEFMFSNGHALQDLIKEQRSNA